MSRSLRSARRVLHRLATVSQHFPKASPVEVPLDGGKKANGPVTPGRFITVEGIDGAGKSSHIAWLRELLEARGQHVVVTREPGGTPLGEKLRDLLLNEPMQAETELLLMFAARAEHLAVVIRPALARGDWVISDRFTDASFAYQVGGRGIAASQCATLATLVQAGLQPDRTLLFDVSVATAQARMQESRVLDRFEREAADFHQRVRDAYAQCAERFPERIRRIASDVPVPQVREQILAALADVLPQ